MADEPYVPEFDTPESLPGFELNGLVPGATVRPRGDVGAPSAGTLLNLPDIGTQLNVGLEADAGDSIETTLPDAAMGAWNSDAATGAAALESYLNTAQPYTGQVPAADLQAASAPGASPGAPPPGVPGLPAITATEQNSAGYLASRITGATPDAALIEALQSAAYAAGGQAALMAPTVTVSGQVVMAGGSARVGSRNAPASVLVLGSEYGGAAQFEGGGHWFHPTVAAWVADQQARQPAAAQQVAQQAISHDPFATGVPLQDPEEVAQQLSATPGLQDLTADDVTIARKRFFEGLQNAQMGNEEKAQGLYDRIMNGPENPFEDYQLSKDPIGSHWRGPGQPKFEHQSYFEWLAHGSEQIWSDPERGIYSKEDIALGLGPQESWLSEIDKPDPGFQSELWVGDPDIWSSPLGGINTVGDEQMKTANQKMMDLFY